MGLFFLIILHKRTYRLIVNEGQNIKIVMGCLGRNKLDSVYLILRHIGRTNIWSNMCWPHYWTALNLWDQNIELFSICHSSPISYYSSSIISSISTYLSIHWNKQILNVILANWQTLSIFQNKLLAIAKQ